MKGNDACLKRVDANPSVVDLYMTDGTLRRYSQKSIHEYANNKPVTRMDMAKFQKVIDRDYWFSRTGRKPTIRILADEYARALKTDLDCPVTLLSGLFMPDGATTPYDGWVLLDGTHRLLKCLITGRDTLNVVQLTAAELRQHVVEID